MFKVKIVYVCGMAEELPDYDDYYIFSKDRKSYNSISGDNGITAVPNGDYVNVYEQERKQRNNYYAQRSLPNLKQSNISIYRRRIFSESEPLLGGQNPYAYRSYLCGERIEISRYRRGQIFLFFYVVFYMAYLIVGSICFQRLEIEMELSIRDEFRQSRQSFLKEYPEVKGSDFFLILQIKRVDVE